MKKLYLFIYAFMALALPAHAQQTLTGKVVDAETGQPISGVSVFLDGTSLSTVTNDDGLFRLMVTEPTNANLIFSHINYRLTALPNPFGNPNQTIGMKPSQKEISTVVVRATDKTKRAYDEDRQMKAFKEMFLGTTTAGLSCEILNPEDITLYYDYMDNTLTAKAVRPIRFINHYLGYTVDFTLLDFKAQYFEDASNLSSYSAGESYFMGLTLFHDDKPTDPKTNNNRLEVFSTSPTFFFRNLVRGQLYENTAFRMYKNGEAIPPEDFFIVHDIEGRKLVQIRPEQIEAGKQSGRLPKGVCASCYITVGGVIVTEASRSFESRTYDPANPMKASFSDENVDLKHLSQIYFYTDKFFVDDYGNVENPNVIRFSGALGQIKAGDMLPDDYRPRLTSDVRKYRKAEKQKGSEEQPEESGKKESESE